MITNLDQVFFAALQSHFPCPHLRRATLVLFKNVFLLWQLQCQRGAACFVARNEFKFFPGRSDQHELERSVFFFLLGNWAFPLPCVEHASLAVYANRDLPQTRICIGADELRDPGCFWGEVDLRDFFRDRVAFTFQCEVEVLAGFGVTVENELEKSPANRISKSACPRDIREDHGADPVLRVEVHVGRKPS